MTPTNSINYNNFKIFHENQSAKESQTTSLVLTSRLNHISGDSLFCMKKDDTRFEPMCCHFLSNSPCEDVLLGAEECQSPFGTYNISIPIDETAPCTASSSAITDKNCKDFDVSFKVHILVLMSQHKPRSRL